MTPERWRVLAIFILTVSLWLFSKPVSELLGVAKGMDSMTALLAVVLLCAARVVHWGDIERSTEWGVLILFGGGITLSQITGGSVPEWVGGLVICVVVMTYVTYGGLRGTAWVNTFQTLVFMILGAVAFFWIVRQLGGLEAALARVSAQSPELLIRGDKIQPLKLLTYLTIPLSVGMFPHIFMHWLTARRAESFRLPIVAYPLCVAAVWVPSVLLGVLGTADMPGLDGPRANEVLVRMIHAHAPELLAGFLAGLLPGRFGWVPPTSSVAGPLRLGRHRLHAACSGA